MQACFCRSLIEVDSNLSLIKLDLLLGQSVVRLVGCDQALDHIYTETYAVENHQKPIKQTPWPKGILPTYLIDPLGPPEGPPRPPKRRYQMGPLILWDTLDLPFAPSDLESTLQC